MPKIGDQLDYAYHVTKANTKAERKPKKIQGNSLKFESLVWVTIGNMIHKFYGATYKEIRNVPIYEGYNFELTLYDDYKNGYVFGFNYHSRDCIKIMKEKLSRYQSCSDEVATLYYYSQFNFQNGVLDNQNGKVEMLKFNTAC
jgi:hypothetical protein